MNFTSIAPVVLIAVGVTDDTVAQERLKASYASIGATNAIWNIAIERGFYKKHGLDVDVVYIGSTTVTAAAILGQDVPIAISRIGSVSDAATRELLKSVGLKPIDDVALRQIGGAPERISAFSQGAVAGLSIRLEAFT